MIAAVLYQDSVYVVSYAGKTNWLAGLGAGQWEDLHSTLHLPGARPGVVLGGIFIPFDRKIPYMLKKIKCRAQVWEWVCWECEQITKGEVKNWKQLTKIMGAEKKKFMAEMFG